MDRPAIDSVLSQVHVPVRDLGGCLSLRGLAGLLSRCDLMLGNDSGPRHLAAAVGTPTVGLYSFFNLINYGPLSQEWHRPVVSWRRSAGEGGSYLTDVTVDEVEARVLEVWEDVHRAGYAKTRENQYATPALAGNARSV